LQQSGFPKETADKYVEMFSALGGGKFLEDYWKHRPEFGKIKLEDFAKEFAAGYKQVTSLSSITP